jgi:16S rRNA (guanine1207-N2)-methyltransferase
MNIQKFSVNLGEQHMEVCTTRGLPNWRLISPSTHLLSKYCQLNPSDHVLLFGSHLGSLPVYILRWMPDIHLTITDYNDTALQVTRQTLSANTIKLGSVSFITDIDLLPEWGNSQTAVLMLIPKGRALARRWLMQAFHVLKPGGRLYLAGSNRAGIQSITKDAALLFGGGSVLGYKKGNRVVEFSRQPVHPALPDWASYPGIAPHTWVEFSVTISDHSLAVRSLPGIFSHDHLDKGTSLLLNTICIPADVRVLDVGCGYGIIGLSAAVKGASLVHLVDNNLLAVAACRETMALNNINNAEVFSGDLLDPVAAYKYDLILSNPPFHAGQAVDYQIAQAMIAQSHQALKPGGQLVIVANRFIRYDRLIKEIYGNVSIPAETGIFHLLSGLKSSQLYEAII